MKKLISLLLALTMLLGCTALGETIDYTGVWVLTGAESQGVEMGPSTLARVGLEMVMTLNADGTTTISAMGMEETATWVATENGIAVTDTNEGVEETVEYPYQNGMLLVEDHGSILMFTREGAAPAVAEAAGPVALSGVLAEAFEGQWLLTHASIMGVEMPAEPLGLYMALVLTEGEGLFAADDGSGDLLMEAITYAVNETEGVGTVLEIYVTDETTGVSAVALALLMSQDGMLYLEEPETGVVLFFTRQVEETAAE